MSGSFISSVEVGSGVWVIGVGPLNKIEKVTIFLLEEMVKVIDNRFLTIVEFFVFVNEKGSKLWRDQVWGFSNCKG